VELAVAEGVQRPDVARAGDDLDLARVDFQPAGFPSPAVQRARSRPSKSTTASDGGGANSPGDAAGVTTGGAGRLLSCTRHLPPGRNGVSS
jgi:hypothetical protein